ncbi:MAG: glycosyltransferase [Bacillales bacterium]|nr:glycosyltransferase [Bacillales bacterium]
MKKIAILSLHLNYGGVEKAVSTLANMLCDDYKVEIICTYKMGNKPVYKIDDKVKIKYLIPYGPNKKEIKQNFKNFKIFNLLKEGIKAIKVLYLRKNTMIDYIKNSDADVIISTRVLFTNYLSKYGKESIIKIAQEHRHHLNDQKYIQNLNDACKNIDYLLPVSKELTNFYTATLTGKVKCYYMPNSLDNIPEIDSDYTKNVVTVGRLSKEKGFDDLIDVFKKVVAKNPNYKLDIIGDGPERNNLKDIIANLHLENNIILHGFQNKDYINDVLSHSKAFIVTSYTESFGIALLEGMSYGLPGIIFDSASGSLELIKNNFSGYVIKNRSKDVMAKKIIKLLDNKKEISIMGKNAKETAKKYSFEKIKERWLNFLEIILKGEEINE